MIEQTREPRPVLPFVDPFYCVPLAWPLVRLGVGWNLIVHGWGKMLRGPAGQAALLARDGSAFSADSLRQQGNLNGCADLRSILEPRVLLAEDRYEYTLLWGVISLAIALRGGAEFSLDRKIGCEL